MKRKNVLFLILAVVVAAGVVGIFMNYPPVDKRDAQGTIGAVEKYRTEQINNAGVVLADEKTRAEESLAYGDYLDQATQLQATSVQLANLSLEARSAAARDNLGVIAKALDARTAVLSQKIADQATELAAQKQLEAHRAELEAIATNLKARQLDMKQLEAMRHTLEKMSRAVGIRSFEARAMEARKLEAETELEARKLEARKLEARKLEADAELEARMAEAKTQLEGVTRRLSARALDAKAIEAMQTHLQMADSALQARAIEHRSLEAMIHHFEARVMEARAMVSARLHLGPAMLGLDQRTTLDARQAELDNLSRDMANRAAMCEAMAVLGMQRRLDARNYEARALEAIDADLESISHELSNRAVDNKTALEAMKNYLQSMKQVVESRNNDLAQRTMLSARSEIGAIGNYLDARAALWNKAMEARAAGNKSLANVAAENRAIENRKLDARSFENRNLDNFKSYVNNLSFVMANRKDLAATDRGDFGAKAEALQSRLALSARSAN